MYCPTCGTALTHGLSYCNRCGASLSLIKGSETAKALEKSIESTMWAIVAITATMLGIMVAVIALMKGFGLSGGAVVLFMALMFLTLLGIDGVFVWRLLSLNRRAREAGGASQLEGFDAKGVGAQPEQAMLEPRMSVTEDATQRFEPSYEERRTK